MKIAFVSNYFNHHQQAFCDVLYRESDSNFVFLETLAMRQERKDLGYATDRSAEYVIDCTENLQDAFNRLAEADIIILGIGDFDFRKKVIALGKITFIYSERILKHGTEVWKLIPRWLRLNLLYGGKRNLYLLSVGRYSYLDYLRFGLFRNSSYRWGYFPRLFSSDDPEKLMCEKDPHRILWCGRFIDWKHMEVAVKAVCGAVTRGCKCRLDFIGTGAEQKRIEPLIDEEGARGYIGFLGAMKPEEVRRHMLDSSVLLVTSDRNEGWGAVVNEAMNSGCAVIASDEVGAATYLIRDGYNGFIAESGNAEAFADIIVKLMSDSELLRRIGVNAYDTISGEWNADVAGKRLWEISCSLYEGKEPLRYHSGPMSDASVEERI